MPDEPTPKPRRKEADHPFYRPLWVRVALCASLAAWAFAEVIVLRDPLFTVLTLAALAWATWTFLITYKDNTGSPPKEPPPGA